LIILNEPWYANIKHFNMLVGVMDRQGKSTPHNYGGFFAASQTAILFWKAAIYWLHCRSGL